MNKKKILVFSGAGLDKESNVNTFRDTENGLWYNHNIDEVATLSGWKKDREKVIKFHNLVRRSLHDTEPNEAHNELVSLENYFDITNVTQNVTDLLEKAGATNVLHLHGEIMKCRSSLDPNLIYDCRGSISIGDKCEKGSQLRPHTVLFEEYPYNIAESIRAINECDVLIIIGTSFQIGYTVDLIMGVKPDAPIFFIDPDPVNYFDDLNIIKVRKTASEGVKYVKDILLEKYF